MPLLDDLMDVLMQPHVLTPALNMLSRRMSAGDQTAEDKMIERIDRLQEKIEEIAQSRRGGRPRKGKEHGFASSPADLAEVRDTVVQIAGSLKEAARFARADGTDHPEAKQRIEDALNQIRDLPYLERYVLSPERVASLPEGQRRVIESIQPALRRLRQVDRVQVSKVKGLEDAAGLAGTIATQLQVAAVASGQGSKNGHERSGGGSSGGGGGGSGGKPYSLYAPDMSVDTGCIECGRSHLSGTAKTIELAAQDAQTKGVDHPDVAARITFALEELDMLNKYDWLPDKIARNSPDEQRILNEYAPKVKELRELIGSARDPLTLARLAKRAKEIKESYLAHTDRLVKDQAVFALLSPTPTATGKGTARVSRRAVDHYSLPTLQEIRTFSAPENVNQLLANIARRLTERGVRVQTIPLVSSEEMSTEGQYVPSTNTLELNGGLFGLEFLGAENPYALQVMIHEAAHALLHNGDCLHLPGGRITPEIERLAEDEAEGVTVATMLELGLPVMDRDGEVIIPGQRMVEWDRVRELVDPQEFENVKWATEWIKRAAKGEDGELVREMCPVLRPTHRTESAVGQGFVKGPNVDGHAPAFERGRPAKRASAKPPLYQGPPINLHEEVEKAQQAARQAGYGSMMEKFIAEGRRELERIQRERPSFQRTNFILTAIDHMGREGMNKAVFTDADGTSFQIRDLGDHYSVTVNYGPQGLFPIYPQYSKANAIETINLPKETLHKLARDTNDRFNLRWGARPGELGGWRVVGELPGMPESQETLVYVDTERQAESLANLLNRENESAMAMMGSAPAGTENIENLSPMARIAVRGPIGGEVVG